MDAKDVSEAKIGLHAAEISNFNSKVECKKHLKMLIVRVSEL